MTMRAKRYQNFAALPIFMRRTAISHFSFLISHSGESFKCNQGEISFRHLTNNKIKRKCCDFQSYADKELTRRREKSLTYTVSKISQLNTHLNIYSFI